MIIGLVSEGVTELPIIQNVIIGHTGDTDLIVQQLSPIRDATNAIKPENLGGWSKVLEYIGSSVFRAAVQYMDAIIVQIDTDVCEDFGVSRNGADGSELAPVELLDQVRDHLVSRIETEFYNSVGHRIIFAITVDSIECWLLPLFYTDNRATKHKNCVDTLNQQIRSRGYTIGHKDYRVYEELSAPLKKKKELTRVAQKQLSLGQFVAELAKLSGQS